MTPRILKELYPIVYFYRLHLDVFRRKPAISEFDKSFTPNHKSSQSFSTDTSSVLQIMLT